MLDLRDNEMRFGSCESCAVRPKAICGVLQLDALRPLNAFGHHRRLARGQTLIWEGDDSVVVANVIEGVLKLSTSLGDGREQIVGIAYPSDFIGRPFGRRSCQSVTALTDSKLCLFSRVEFDAFARSQPDLEHELLQRTLRELDRARSFMTLLARKTAAERVATLLLDVAQRLGQPGERIELPFTRQQMADLLGMTIETVSRQLSRLKRQGIVALPDRRGLVIRDQAALAATAGPIEV